MNFIFVILLLNIHVFILYNIYTVMQKNNFRIIIY